MEAVAQRQDPLRQVGKVRKTLLWLSDLPMPANVAEAVTDRYEIRPISLADSLVDRADGAEAALIYVSDPTADPRRLISVLEHLDRTSLVGLLLLPEKDWSCQELVGGRGRFAVAVAEGSPGVIAAQISAVLQLRPAIVALQKEIAQIRTLGGEMGQTLDLIDEEMRLAARLQRDFLPKSLPEVGPLRFSTLFRPATWVSGDIYSVERLDERCVGFYVADAVGHGLPAALLTLFIKRALPTKRIKGDRYEIVPPDASMAALNQAICEQDLSNCQFCSALYCIVDSETLEMTYARGGHPEAILLHADGRASQLPAAGGLVGVLPEESYELARAQLAPGDRVVLHSDGAEDVFRHSGAAGREEFLAIVEQGRHLSPDEMVLQLASAIDTAQGSLHPADDVTLVVLDVAR